MSSVGAHRPGWDDEFPGLMAWELDMLRRRATNVVEDAELLNRGVLAVDFEWPISGSTVALRAVFPPTYPYFRPHVFLRTDPTSWPQRHVSPLDGGLCLLGRDSAQWQPESYLVELLQNQLQNALDGTGPQDPQAEPAEYWWNQRALPGCYLLIDSSWDLSSASHGTLEVRYLIQAPATKAAEAPPSFRAIVTRVYDESGATIAAWDAPVPDFLQNARSVTIAWQRLPQTVLPVGQHLEIIHQLRTRYPRTRGLGFPAWPGQQVRPFVFLHEVELTEVTRGDGWLVGIQVGHARAFVPPRPGQPTKHTTHTGIVSILRAGRGDLGVRVPVVSALAAKTVAVVGCGALGAPIAIELARNGVRRLHLLDHDAVEPGNSVRWPLGAPVWGMSKVDALSAFVAAHYPGCAVEPFVHALGAPSDGADETDADVLTRLLDGVDLVIDASASESVNRLMWQRCQDRGAPLVRLGATPSVKGGTVAYHAVRGACPVCVQHARIAGTVPKPAGHDDIGLMQPAGCGERTFVGAGYDLHELSMHAVRTAVATLQTPEPHTLVYTLHLRDAFDGVIPPRWDTSVLNIHADCPCHGRPGP